MHRSQGSSGKAPVTFPLYQDIRTRPLPRLKGKRADDTSAEVINMTSTSYLIERKRTLRPAVKR